MPTLKPYEAGVQGLRPSETGIEATAAAARRLSGIVSEIAEAKEKTGRIFSSTISDIGTLAHDHMAAIEVNRGAPAWAAKQLSLEQQWDATHKASPDNPANVPKFLNETLEPQLQQFRNSFFTDVGQQWAEKRIDSFRESMYKKAQADSASARGVAQATNSDQAIGLLEHSAVNNGTPDKTQENLNTWQDTAKKMRLSAEATEAGNKRIVAAGISGAIINSRGQLGVGDLDWAKEERFAKHWNAIDDRKTFDALQKNESTKSRVAEKAEFAAHKQEVRQGFNKKIDAIEDALTPDENGVVHVPKETRQMLTDLHDDEGAKFWPKDYRRILSKVNTAAEKEAKTADELPPAMSRSNMFGLWQNITDAPEFSELIDSHYRAGNINQREWSFLHARWKEMQSEDGKDFNEQRRHFFAGMLEQIQPPLGDVTTTDTKERMARFGLEFEKNRAALIKKGEDPWTLFDEKSPNYMFGGDYVVKYGPKSMQQQIQTPPAPAPVNRGGAAAAPTPTTAAPNVVRTETVRKPETAAPTPAEDRSNLPYQPGESLNDYLTRRGKRAPF